MDIFDEDLEDESEDWSSTRHQLISDQIDIYNKVCKKNKIAPMSSVIKQLAATKLVLKHRSLNHSDIFTICIPLVHNIFVTELDFTGNCIGSKGVSHLVDLVLDNTLIKALCLSENGLDSQSIPALETLIKDGRFLTKLLLAKNKFTERDAKALCSAQCCNKSLLLLDLSFNAFSEESGRWIGRAIATNCALKTLRLKWNHLRLKGSQHIAKALETNCCLAYLDLSWNGFGNDGAAAIGEALKKNNTLVSIDLSCNRISHLGAKSLADGIAVNKALLNLGLRMNPISTRGALHLLQSIADAKDKGIVNLDLTNVPVTTEFQAAVDVIREKNPQFKLNVGRVVNAHTQLSEITITHTDSPFHKLIDYAHDNGWRLWDLFQHLDKNGDLCVDSQELRIGLQNAEIHISQEQLRVLMKKLDTDGNGLIDFSEFIEGNKRLIYQSRRKRQAIMPQFKRALTKAEAPESIDAQTALISKSDYR